MKTLLSLLIVVSMAFSVAGQEKKSSTSTKKQAATKVVAKKYWCTQCDFSSVNPGECPTHKKATVMEGWYFCYGQESKASSNRGTCSDGTEMIKMDQELVKKNSEA